ncbi:ferrochelatase [Persicirhabdus sediminis]|uniref:Ferrochelatase n=1 Tax=Persicirhabdus sediminis TaxID=454144 RepID=A0A8J7MEU9_9BACT|nr:ferrochelatase [Persicirhabdus sediminis]MBK1791390.1 ferrochelatase [Persicirhabdus sediminis]
MKAALLLNLGSPDSTEVADVRAYLDEFLSDERVLDMPAWKRTLLLKLIILPKRSPESAEAYSEVWTDEGSPLVVTSEHQQEKVANELDIPVYLAMRYGNPSIRDIISQIKKDGVTELFIMPLYPQYAMSSYETVVVKVMEELAEQAPSIKTGLLQPFYKDPQYISALADSVKDELKEDTDLLLMSFHGIPERHVRISDPSHSHCLAKPDCCVNPHPCHATCYKHQCLTTADLLTKELGLADNKVAVSFQSRLLKDPWLGPYTDFELERFAKEGVKKIQVICPAFVADCLETLEEIGMRGKEDFIAAGGDSLELIPCVNEHPSWIKYLVDQIEDWAK